jgi:hypothetical protein
MKTLANCTPKEFAVQTAKIAGTVRKYADGVRAIRKKLPKLPDNATAEDIRNAGVNNFMDILSWCMETNIDGTMELCGAVCFMSGEEFANLDPSNGDDGVAAVLEVLCSERALRFFATLLRASNFIGRL